MDIPPNQAPDTVLVPLLLIGMVVVLFFKEFYISYVGVRDIRKQTKLRDRLYNANPSGPVNDVKKICESLAWNEMALMVMTLFTVISGIYSIIAIIFYLHYDDPDSLPWLSITGCISLICGFVIIFVYIGRIGGREELKKQKKTIKEHDVLRAITIDRTISYTLLRTVFSLILCILYIWSIIYVVSFYFRLIDASRGIPPPPPGIMRLANDQDFVHMQ